MRIRVLTGGWRRQRKGTGWPESFFFFFLAVTCGMRDLIASWPGTEPGSPALGVQSLNPWNTTKSHDQIYDDPKRGIRAGILSQKTQTSFLVLQLTRCDMWHVTMLFLWELFSLLLNGDNNWCLCWPKQFFSDINYSLWLLSFSS